LIGSNDGDKFSRHAKRRAKLYGIPESTVSAILKKTDFTQGEHKIITDIGQKYPLKKGRKK
jgi:hypothetical protein